MGDALTEENVAVKDGLRRRSDCQQRRWNQARSKVSVPAPSYAQIASGSRQTVSNTQPQLASNPIPSSNLNPNPNPNPTPSSNPNTSPNPNPNRTSQTLTGYASGGTLITTGGRGETAAHSSSAGRVRVLSLDSTVSITTDAVNNQAKGTIVIPDFNGSHRHHASAAAATSSTATLQLGRINGMGANNSAFIDDKTYAMLTQTNDPIRRSTLQTGRNTQRLHDTTLLASANAAGVTLPSNPGCTCEFLSWGWWASNIPDPRHPGHSNDVLGNYVAGKVTTAVQMPTTGSATYNGFMGGLVRDHGDVRLGAGSYQMNWNFQNRNGMFNGSFDNRPYSGNASANATTPQNFNGTFYGGNRSGQLNGSFFASPTDAAAYQGGNFAIRGPHYQATGIFAGQR